MSKHLLTGLLMAGLAFTYNSALAQDNEEDDDGEIIDLIEVVAQPGWRATSASSATGLNVPIDSLPINLQVITSDVISDFQLLSQRDALQFHAAADDKRVRGFNTGEFFRNGFIHLSDTPGYTIERVEIIRGPSAVLNGPVTPGGAVNIISKSPIMDESFGEVGTFWGVSGDDRDNRGFNVDFNMGTIGPERDGGPLGAFRFVGGFQEDTGFGTRANNESSSLLPMLELRPGRDTVMNFEYYGYRINTDRADRPMAIETTIPGPTAGEEIPIALAYDVDPRTSWFYDNTDIEESLGDYSISIAHQFTDSLLGRIAYNNHSRDFEFAPGNRPRIDIFYRMVLNAGAPAGSTDPDDYMLRRLTEQLSLENDIDQATASLAFVPGGNSDHQFVGGVHLYDQDAHLTIQRPRLSGTTSGFYFEFFDAANVKDDDLSFNSAGDDVFWVTVLDRLEAIDQTNVFINYHGTFLDDRLNVLLGVTHSSIDIERADPRISPLSWTEIADSTETLLQAGAVYTFTESVAAYVNYSESQLPDLNDPDFSTAPPVRIGEQLEVGVRLSLFDGMLDANLAYFTIDEELSGETFRDAEADGFELDGSINPSDNWSIIYSYATADTKITDSSDPADIGDPLVDEVPKKAAIWTLYSFDEGGAAGLSIGGGLVWTGERVRSTAGAAQALKKLDGQVLNWEPETRVDLFAKYDFGEHWEISLNLRNITEEVNISNNVPRVPLQGGVKANGDPYVFDGDMEVMFGVQYRY